MNLNDLFEDVEQDAEASRAAHEALYAFQAFLRKKNPRLPLGEMVDTETFRTKRGPVIGFKASHLGLPYNDLYIGFGSGNTQASATMIRAKRGETMFDDGEVFYIVTFWAGKDIAEKSDLSSYVDGSSFVHEFIHYLDYKRGIEAARAKQEAGLKRPASNAAFRRSRDAEAKRLHQSDGVKNPVGYYNQPSEMNAYYLQGIREIASAFVRMARGNPAKAEQYLADQSSFFDRFLGSFNADWMRYLNPENRKKVLRRLGKLYASLRETWPNVDLMKRAIGMVCELGGP